MTISRRIQSLKSEYLELSKKKRNLLKIITEAEVSEMVFNSNAIENSTLTLEETERVLLELELSRYISARELLEARNLARIIDYLEKKENHVPIDIETILLLHKMLISGIDDDIAGRFRNNDEYVRIGKHIAPDPEKITELLTEAINQYKYSTLEPLEAITLFHLEFERIHPFCDGNGRTGRVIMNVQLAQHNFPPIIIRNKDKYGAYYPHFDEYNLNRSPNQFTKIIQLYVSESLNKRLSYLKNQEILKQAKDQLNHYSTQQEGKPLEHSDKTKPG